MYIQYRNLQLIERSARTDEENEAILNGDYLDKSPKYEYPEGYDDSVDGGFLRPIEVPFVMPSKDEMMKFIFSDWQKGDILVIADYPLKHPKLQGDTLVEMTREEICESGDLSILVDGEYFENGKIIKVEYNQELGYLKPIWNKDVHQFVEGASDVEQVQAQINEYSELDTPSILKEMGTELANECMDMLIQLRGMAYGLENSKPLRRRKRAILELPQPSIELKAFKDRFNSIK